MRLAMNNSAGSRRTTAAPQGMKTLITVASVAATLGGWAIFAGQPLPATPAGATAPGATNSLPAAPANQAPSAAQAQPTPASPFFGQNGTGTQQSPFFG